MSISKFSITLVMVLTLVTMATLVYSADDTDATQFEPSITDTKGQLGDNLNWKYNSSTKELTVSGSGPTYKYYWYFEKWSASNHISTLTVKGSDIEIADEVFYKVKADSIVLDGVTKLGANTFRYSTATTLSISKSLSDPGMYSFANCNNLQTLNIDVPNLYGKGHPIFYNCISLKWVNYGENATHIYGSEFNKCTNISNISYTSSVEWISWDGNQSSNKVTFDLIGLNKLKMFNIKNLNQSTVILPSSIEHLYLDNSSTTNIVFSSCNLQNLSLKNLPGLNSLNLGGVTSIEQLELEKLTALSSLNFGMMGADAIKNLSWINVSSISVAEANPELCVIDNVLYSKDLKKLIYYPSGKTSATFTVPEDVEEINTIENNYLTSVILHKNLKSCGRIVGNEIQILNIPTNIVSGVYDYNYNYAALKIVVMPTEYHYSQVDNKCAILKYYSKYIDSVTAKIETDGKITIHVDTVDGFDYPFRIGVKYNEDNVLGSSSGFASLPNDVSDYPAVYLSIISGEEEDSHEWTPPKDSGMSILEYVGLGLIALGFLLIVVPLALFRIVPLRLGIGLIAVGFIVSLAEIIINSILSLF